MESGSSVLFRKTSVAEVVMIFSWLISVLEEFRIISVKENLQDISKIYHLVGINIAQCQDFLVSMFKWKEQLVVKE